MNPRITRLITAALASTALLASAQAQTFREAVQERIAERRLAQTEAALPVGASVQRDIAYGPAPRHKLDVYRPADDRKEATGAPLIVMVHGGAWITGDKAAAGVVTNKLTHWVTQGGVLVSINYRLVPVAGPVEQADDVARALAHIQAHAAQWGADPATLVLMGHSAGAHLVALVAADAAIAARAGAKPWRATIALDSAAFDVTKIMAERHPGFYDKAFGADPAYWREASPLLRLTTQLAAPLLAVCSSQRRDACPQAEVFADRAATLGGARVTVLPVDLSHGEINTLLGTPGTYTADVQAFIASLGLR